MHQPRQKIRRRRRDQHHIVVARQIDVRHSVIGPRVPQIRKYGLPRERLKRCRPDELRRRFRHHHCDFASRFDEQSRQLRRFVRRNSASNAQQNALCGLDVFIHVESVAGARAARPP